MYSHNKTLDWLKKKSFHTLLQTSSGLRTTQHSCNVYSNYGHMLAYPQGKVVLRSGVLKRTLSHIKQPFPKGMHIYAYSYYISCSYVGLSSDLKKSTVVDESLSVSINPMFCYKNSFNYSMESQQNEKSTQETSHQNTIFNLEHIPGVPIEPSTCMCCSNLRAKALVPDSLH